MTFTDLKRIRITLFKTAITCLLLLLIQTTSTAQSAKIEHVNTHYSNGKLKEKGKKKDGLKHGTWLIYNQGGWLELRIKYKKDIAVWQVFYDSKQRKVKMIDKNGQEVPYKGCNCKS